MPDLTKSELLAAAYAVEHLIAKHQFDAIRSRDGEAVKLEPLKARLIEEANR